MGKSNKMKLTVSRVWHERIAVGLLLAVLAAIPDSAFPSRQAESQPTGLLVTPSSSVLIIGENSTVTAVDGTGRPVKPVQWSVDPPIADIQDEAGEFQVVAKQTGRAIVTATANNQSGMAILTVVPGGKLAPATVRWSLQPMAGFETLVVMPAMPSGGGPVFYSIEWSQTSNAIVRALGEDGQQMWMAQLSSTASPMTLKHELPVPGEMFQNGARLSDHSQMLIGEKTAYVTNSTPNQNVRGLPMDGKSILLRVSGDDSGGLLLLERGRFRDSLVDLSPTDGSEIWRYRSEGRLTKNWTVNREGNVGIVETLAKPASSALLVLNSKSGQVRFRTPFPISSSTIDGFRCKDPQHNILKNERPSLSGSVFTSTDGNMYVQVATHIESAEIDSSCKSKQYSFDNSLALLRVSPDGETEWRTFQHIHADGNGEFVAQPRVFAGESIPDGFGGVLAAWTYFFPGVKGSEKPRFEARLTRISPKGQQDFTLPMPYWSQGISSIFDQNMVLGEGNPLYATNGPLLLKFDTQAGVVNWVRHPPTGEVKLHHSTAGGGLLVSNAGRFVYFDAQGNGADLPWTVAPSNPGDVGLVQSDLLEHTPLAPLQLRDAKLCWSGNFVAVEDGTPYGLGRLIYFSAR